MLSDTLGGLITEECSKFSVNELAGLIGVSPEELADLGKEPMPILPTLSLAPENRPSCFANPITYDTNSTRCHGCAVRTECSLLFKTGVWPEELPEAPFIPPFAVPHESAPPKAKAKKCTERRRYREKKAAAGMKKIEFFAPEDFRKSLREFSAARNMTFLEAIEDLFKAHAKSSEKIQRLEQENRSQKKSTDAVYEVAKKTIKQLKATEVVNNRLKEALIAIKTQLNGLALEASTESLPGVDATPVETMTEPEKAESALVAKSPRSEQFTLTMAARMIGIGPQKFNQKLVSGGWMKKVGKNYRITDKGAESKYVRNSDVLRYGNVWKQVKVTPEGVEKFTEMFKPHTQLKIMP